MRKLVLVITLAALAATPVLAQQEPSMELTRAVIQAERRAIVEAAVKPAPEQAEKFWKIYWEYRGQVSALGDRMVALIEEYATSEASLTDRQAERMVAESLAIQREAAELKERYSRKLKDVLQPKQIVRWVQVENKMDAVINYEISVSIPLAE